MSHNKFKFIAALGNGKATFLEVGRKRWREPTFSLLTGELMEAGHWEQLQDTVVVKKIRMYHPRTDNPTMSRGGARHFGMDYPEYKPTVLNP